jgi:hypothetical protein
MKIFLDDEVMFQTLAAAQKMRPELWGTIPREFDGKPAYINTFDPESPEDGEQNAEETGSDPMEAEMSQLERKNVMPKTLVPIPLEVVEGGDIKTYLSEMTNMMNVPFEEGAPLVKVRMIRHPGGTDLLVAGHQSLFDNESFAQFCIQILDLYDIASEGRLTAADDQGGHMLQNIDQMYHESFHTQASRIGFQSHLKRILKNMGSSMPWKRLPYTNRDSAPPSPFLNASSVMFGRLSPEQSKELAKQCAKQGVSVQNAISAATLLCTASLIYQCENQKEAADLQTSPVGEPIETPFKAQKRQKKMKSKQAPSESELPNNNPSWLEKLFGSSKQSEKPKEDESKIIPIVTYFNYSIRDYFDPPIAPLIIGNLSTYLMAPNAISIENSIWKLASDLKEMRETANLNSAIFQDLHLMPHIAKFCASESEWKEPIVPSLMITDTSTNPMPQEMHERFAIFDSKATASCWIPGVHVSSHIDQKELQISVAYRRPLISDAVSHKLLTSILKQLSL